jgi:hypothetical protein
MELKAVPYVTDAGAAHVMVGVTGTFVTVELLPDEHPRIARAADRKTICLRKRAVIILI